MKIVYRNILAENVDKENTMKSCKRFFITGVLISLCSFASLAVAATQTAIFAGGCFWSMQHDFDKVSGVVATTVGYTGGTVANPSYEQVSNGDTGHYEAIKVEYDPTKITYQQLLTFFIHDIDPSDTNGEFCDKGNEYHSVIFYDNSQQQSTANGMITSLIDSKQFPYVATKVLPAKTFYPAEDYHQKYSDKNPTQYSAYRKACGRDQSLADVWSK
jgi:peptide-methionine (S)-S-oxide reductase